MWIRDRSNDVIELIKLIKSRYNVNLFVSIFAAGQKVPPLSLIHILGQPE